MRRGFSLIEALVALVIFGFGMLALGATSAVVARDLGAANRRARAHALASMRVEQLRVSACTDTSGRYADTRAGMTEVWRIEADGPRRAITDSVAFAVARGRRSSVVQRAWLLCPS